VSGSQDTLVIPHLDAGLAWWNARLGAQKPTLHSSGDCTLMTTACYCTSRWSFGYMIHQPTGAAWLWGDLEKFAMLEVPRLAK